MVFVRFDHFVTGFGDHFWVLLRDTVFLVNVILYLIVCLIFLMVLVILSFVLLNGWRMVLCVLLLIVCLMIARILAAFVRMRIASVVMTAVMLWKSCLVRFMSLFFIPCFDVVCLLFFWYLSRVFRSALSDVCVLCLIPAIIACVLETLQFFPFEGALLGCVFLCALCRRGVSGALRFWEVCAVIYGG